MQQTNSKKSKAPQILDFTQVSRIHSRAFEQQTKSIPQKTRVQNCCHSQVSSQSVRTDSWSILILWLLLQATLNHPPADSSLHTSKTQQSDQSVSELGFEVAFIGKNRERYHEKITQGLSHQSMEELNPINWLETFKIHLSVDGLVLNTLFVFVKLNIPFLFISRVSLSVGAPICHTKTRASEPSVPTQHDHPEYSSSSDEEPSSYKFFLPLDYKFIGDGEIVGIAEGVSVEGGEEGFSDNSVYFFDKHMIYNQPQLYLISSNPFQLLLTLFQLRFDSKKVCAQYDKHKRICWS